MQILTHPKNKIHINKITKELNDRFDNQGIYPCRLGGIPIIFTEDIPAEKWNGQYKKLDKCKFTEYDLEKPSDWEIYFGFVSKEMVPNFILHSPRNSHFLDPFGKVKREEYGKILH